MEQNQAVQDINEFEQACEDAVRVYCEGSELNTIVSQSPEQDLNNTTMQVINQAIESMKARSGLPYNTLSMESAKTKQELKTVSMEGIKDFIRRVWEAIKKAFIVLVKKIKDFFIGNEAVADKIKENLDKANDDFEGIQKDVLKTDKEAVSLIAVIDSPSPYLLHKSLYKGSGNEREIDLHDLVTNLASYPMKSREHHLLEYIRDFKEDVLKLVDGIDTKVGSPDISNQVYCILNNFISEDKLNPEQVANLRKYKDVETKDEFDSEYGSKRYIVNFCICKEDGGSEAEALKTEQIIAKSHVSKQVDKLTITGVEVQDVKHLVNALSDNYTELTNYVKISRELMDVSMAVQGMIIDIENNAIGDIDLNHVIALTVINKAINAVTRLFSVMQGDVTKVLQNHTDLYNTFNQMFKDQLLATQ